MIAIEVACGRSKPYRNGLALIRGGLVTDKVSVGPAQTPISGKRPWISPEVEIAPARSAEAFGGPPGGVDYGFYS